jgi:hypothetical protein
MFEVRFPPLLNMVAVMFQPLSCHVAMIIVAFLNIVAVLLQASCPTRMGISPAAAYLGTRRLETMFLYMFRRSGAILHILEYHTKFLVVNRRCKGKWKLLQKPY